MFKGGQPAHQVQRNVFLQVINHMETWNMETRKKIFEERLEKIRRKVTGQSFCLVSKQIVFFNQAEEENVCFEG